MGNRRIHMVTFLVLLLSFGSIVAQADEKETVTIPLSTPGEAGYLKIGLLYGSITVEAHQGEDVIVETTSKQSSKSQKTKDGMRKIGDTSIEFSVEEYNNKVTVRSRKQNKTVDFLIKVPENFSLDLRATNNGNIKVEGVIGEMEISNLNGAISLVNIGGSVIADALNKNIVVSFTKGYAKSPMAFTSLNGDLDVTFPANLSANVKAKTDNGEIYTDYEMKMTRDISKDEKKSSAGVYKVTVDKWVTGTINGGGEELLFKTMNGDIMIRSN
ncbi:DUF4097 domain-containing protein [Aggregatimonas sangjinii]|uniref:DUF4097 domain-containing protein n=1 Tax=Aggregatimonas sangjinii TaxID=2583587 RepID=A0A5B7SSR6_9FLAO|nr:DUF4097 domain-containing protein [Aggregatimonas sangjinii]QCX01252.1 DUF4097 domain-containing protein [Aggregatimonas sangjinii]